MTCEQDKRGLIYSPSLLELSTVVLSHVVVGHGVSFVPITEVCGCNFWFSWEKSGVKRKYATVPRFENVVNSSSLSLWKLIFPSCAVGQNIFFTLVLTTTRVPLIL